MEIVVQSNKRLEALCPFRGINVIWREFFMGYMAPVIMVSTIAILQLIISIIKCYKPRNNKVKWLLDRFHVGYYIVLS